MRGRLYILLEGNDDTRFFSRILIPLLKAKYRFIKPWRYSQEKHERVVAFVNSAKKIGDCIYVNDINKSPCVTAKKSDVKREFPQLEENEIIVIVKEIESWYLAGLDQNNNKELGLSQGLSNTNDLTKRRFDRLIPKGKSRIEFLQEILNLFDLGIAKTKNQSLRYFVNKWVE